MNRRDNMQVEDIENTTPQSFTDVFQQVGSESPLVDIVASEEPTESPEPPLTDVSRPSRRDVMHVEDIENTIPQSFADVFQEMEGVVESLDFGCQADIHVQQPSRALHKMQRFVHTQLPSNGMNHNLLRSHSKKKNSNLNVTASV